MRIGLYSPYFPKHSGGGERYFLSIAETLSSDHTVSLLVSPDQLKSSQLSLQRYEKLFGLDLSRIHIQESALATGSMLDRLKETSTFDALFAMTDGSFFPTLAKRSYLIMQVPWKRPLSLSERIKLMSWTSILVYSDFVKDILVSSWQTNKIRTLAPYVDTQDFKPDTKEKIILNVGRFFSHQQSNSKRQDVLVDAFQKLVDTKQVKGYQLALVGNVDPNPDSVEYVETIRATAKGYPVSIHQNISYDELRALNSRASFYWHAAGFQVDEKIHPENTEHFGITTLEAMASGVIPLVVPKGGQAEIVPDASQRWESVEELVQKTFDLIQRKEKELELIRRSMREQAQQYSKKEFEQKVHDLI